MEGGRLSGLDSQQDGGQFEDALRRLHALEKKLAGQVQEDICELRKRWIQPRVDRVTNNTFKLYQVRENLKLSKVLYVEEEQVMTEFGKVKQVLINNSMDDETFEAAKETCMVLGGKLGEVRNRQLMCYSDSRDLETAVNKDIMELRFDDHDFQDLDIEHVRCNTPLRELSPTPLDKHRSRDPSPFRMPPMKIGSGTTTPGGTLPPDPHAYFSRPGSSQSMYGGRGGGEKDLDAFRAAMEAKQAQDDSPPKNRKQPSNFPTMLSKSTSGNIVIRSASGQIIGKSDGTDAGASGPVFVSERPSSAMSDMSINIHDFGHISRPESRTGILGDDVSGVFDPFAPVPDHVSHYINQEDTELDLKEEQEIKKKEAEEIKIRAAEQAALIQREAQEKFAEKEKIRIAQEAADKKAEAEAKKEKLRLERECEMKEREERRLADEQKMKDMAEKRKRDAELKKEKELREKEEQKRIKLEEKQEKMRKAEEIKLKKEEEAKKKEDAKQAKLEEKKKKMEAASLKKKAEEEKKIQEELESKRTKEIIQIPPVDATEATDADDEGEKTINKARSKSRSLSKGRTSKKEDAKNETKDTISLVKEEKAAPTETPKLNKPKRRTSLGDKKDESGVSDDEKGLLPPEAQTHIESKPSSHQTSQTGSPISILKGGKRSRDPSKDRAGIDDITADEQLSGKPLSRTGSIKKSSSFSKRGIFAEKKKISFDEDVDLEKFEKESEPIGTAKEIFAAIADTSLEAGSSMLKQRSRDPSRERRGSRGSGSGFPQAEPAEWYPPEGSECDNEDELMIILDTDQQLPGDEKKDFLAKSRSASKDRPGSRGSQASSSSAVSKPGVPELEVVNLPASIQKMIHGMKDLEDAEEKNITRKQESPRARSSSTGFSHLDQFERKLAEMEQELEKETKISKRDESPKSFQEIAADFQETFKYQEEPIYATIAPKADRQTRSQQMTDDGFFINRDEELLSYDQSYEQEEDVGSEWSRNKKVSFAESDERFEFERQKKDTGFRSFTKFFTLGPPKPLKSLPGKEIKQEKLEPEQKPIVTLEVAPTAPKRAKSKDRNINDETTSPMAFMSAMTGGLIDSSKSETGSVFGSLLRGRKSSRSGSRHGSRQSSGDRSSQELWSDDDVRPSSRGSLDPYDGASDVLSDTSIVNKFKKLKKKKPKQVQPEDFDELFARGMALSAKKESESTQDPTMSRRSRRDQHKAARNGALSITVTSPSEGMDKVDGNGARFTPFEVYSQDKAFQQSQKEVGIGYAEKVMSYLDDQAHTPNLSMTNGDTEGGHVSRGRKKHPKAEKQAPLEVKQEARSESGNARSKSGEERKRSREYTKPEDIKLSPVLKRFLFTGEILSASPETMIRMKEALTKKQLAQKIQQQSSSVSYDPYNRKQEGAPTIKRTQHTQGMAPSPGKSFLDAVTGQDVFGASIEGENPEIDAKLAASELLSNTLTMDRNQPKPTPMAMNTSYDPSAIMSTQQKKSQVILPPRPEEPADKGIPVQLVPDKLMANEEFYEQLRSGMKNIDTSDREFDHTQEDPEKFQKYSHHLGRAEFGTLKQRTSARPSAAASRDPSGDRLNQQRPQTAGISRDPSGDRLTVGTKISRQSSRELIRSDSRYSNFSGGLPDLEVDQNIGLLDAPESQAGVQRTVSLLVSGVDMDRPMGPDSGQLDMKAKREEVLKEIAQHKKEIRDAKAWIQNGLMSVVGFGVMVYLQTLESVGP